MGTLLAAWRGNYSGWSVITEEEGGGWDGVVSELCSCSLIVESLGGSSSKQIENLLVSVVCNVAPQSTQKTYLHSLDRSVERESRQRIRKLQ